MYLGYRLLLAGVTLINRVRTPLVFLVMCVASFSRPAQREEIALAERFGETWRAYAARVPMFVPRDARSETWRREKRDFYRARDFVGNAIRPLAT